MEHEGEPMVGEDTTRIASLRATLADHIAGNLELRREIATALRHIENGQLDQAVSLLRFLSRDVAEGQVFMTDEQRLDQLNGQYAARGEIYGGDPLHAHRWTWTPDDGNGRSGHVCKCDAYRP